MSRTSPVGMMLDFAYGRGPADGKACAGKAAQAGDAIADEATAALQALAAASSAWWESKRPAGWTLEQHLAHPAAGCRSAQERALAEAVAACLRQGEQAA